MTPSFTFRSTSTAAHPSGSRVRYLDTNTRETSANRLQQESFEIVREKLRLGRWEFCLFSGVFFVFVSSVSLFSVMDPSVLNSLLIFLLLTYKAIERKRG